MIERRHWPGALQQFGNARDLQITRLELGTEVARGRIVKVHEDSIVIDWPDDNGGEE